ncbi:sugar transferase [Candidatus Hydrogenedentota bacterium]
MITVILAGPTRGTEVSFPRDAIENLRNHGFDDIVICCGSACSFLREVEQDSSVDYCLEPSPQGTAGALRAVSARDRADLLVIEGTMTSHIDLTEMLETHREAGNAATIAAQKGFVSPFVEHTITDDNGRIIEIVRPYRMNGKYGPDSRTPVGAYILAPEALSLIPEDGYYDLKEELLPDLYDRNLPVGLFETTGKAHRILPNGSVSGQELSTRDSDEGGLSAYELCKRAFDLAGGLIGTCLFIAVYPFAAVLIKLCSPGPVLFKQERCGRNGRKFRMIKFRTMSPGAEQMMSDPEFLKQNEVDGPMFKMSDDPRINKAGRILRRFSLDELPQFINILKGDMSLVGPRPLSEKEMRFCPQWRDARLLARPGITGLWQTRCPAVGSFSDWINCDIEYVRTRSLLVDLSIILTTLKIVITGR